jgi:glycosyltransferase involved in cell wall biosynthesis
MDKLISDRFRDLNVCVVVPTYNNATTLGIVLKSILHYTDRIIVVNDGSTDATADVLEKFPAVEVVGYKQNQGKGYALRKGFRRSVERGYAYAITIDSDGQHFADDLPRFLDKLTGHHHAIIIGSRNMAQASVPGKSSFGNKFSNFWFWVETGIRRNDTQSGYRLYPVRALDRIAFFTKKFEFEIEVLVRAAWNGIEVLEVPVKVFYAEKASRISHFRPFRDFTRISILNTFLVLVAFLYIKPRDFLRRLKKKISDRSLASLSWIRVNRILSKRPQ